MTLKTIFDLLNYIVAKNQSGNTMTIPNLNDLIPLAESEILNDELGKLIQSELTPISGELLSISPLRVFRKDMTFIGGTGIITVPSITPTDYVRWVSLGALYGGSWRDIEVVAEREFNQRRGNVLYHPELKPFCRIMNTNFYFIPYDVSDITMTYIRKPVPAYYDYCQDSATLLNVYMPVGSTLVASQNATYDLVSGGLVLKSDVTKSGVTYPYTSISKELEWEDRVHQDIILHILSKVGLNLDKTQLVQYTEMLKKQQNG
jgi:hypothetical protein